MKEKVKNRSAARQAGIVPSAFLLLTWLRNPDNPANI
jgi:hypothetical protein